MRWALSYWSQKSGSTTIGLPAQKHSVTVLLPTCVTTRSTSGRMLVCGRNSSPTLVSANPLPDHVVAQPQLIVLRAHRDDHAVVGLAKSVDQPLHQLGVRRPKRAEAQVDQTPVAGFEAERRLPRLIGRADARLDLVPALVEGV